MVSVFGCDMTVKEGIAATDVISSNWLGLGKKVDEFEAAFAKHIGLPEQNVVMVDNCSNGLAIAVKVLGLKDGARVAVPSLTWVACAHAVKIAGAVPVFVDVDYDTMNVTRETIGAAGKIDAIMVVHYAGMSVDMDPILDLGYPVIEDAAHAVCSTYGGARHCGTIGDVGAFSFDPTKNLATCDGGAVVSSNDDLAKRARSLRYCGIQKSGFENATSDGGNGRWWEYNLETCWPRMLPNNVSAAIALEQLGRIASLQSSRRYIWEKYQSFFVKETWIKTPPSMSMFGDHSWFTYAIKVPKRDELAKYLFDRGIYTTVRYHPLHMTDMYKGPPLPVCERLNDELLNLPLHPRMRYSDIDRVVEGVLDFGKENGL